MLFFGKDWRLPVFTCVFLVAVFVCGTHTTLESNPHGREVCSPLMASPRLLSNSGASAGVPCRRVSPGARIWDHILVTFRSFSHLFCHSNLHIKGSRDASSRFNRADASRHKRWQKKLVLLRVVGVLKTSLFFLGDAVSSLLCANE